MSRVFTREQFYELVWSKPMTHLAKEFAISDVALHKICKKHDIPNPPLGWWAKKAAGKEVEQIPLPMAKSGTVNKIVIASADFSRQSSTIAIAREQARILASESDEDHVALPNPVVERSLVRLRTIKPSDVGIVVADDKGFINCRVAPKSVDRLSIILPRVAWAASRQGFELLADEGSAQFKSETETIGFSISEVVKREKHVLTDAERTEEEAWQRKRDRAAQRGLWDDVFISRPRFPEWDYHPTGQLSFEFEHIYVFGETAPRRTFRDTKTQRLENMAIDIAVGLAVLAAAKAELRRKREAEQRRMEEERRRRELVARAKHIEDRRTAGLNAILTELDSLERLRRLIAILTNELPVESTPRLSTFIAWSREHLEECEARLSAQAIDTRLSAERLFGEDDDHSFVPSRW